VNLASNWSDMASKRAQGGLVARSSSFADAKSIHVALLALLKVRDRDHHVSLLIPFP
jgi:hypothetical protein